MLMIENLRKLILRRNVVLRVAGIGTAALGALVASWPAAAVVPTGALLPLLMRYDLCAHSRAATEEAIRVQCASEREVIVRDADPILEKFYPAGKLDAKEALNVALGRTNREAARLARRGQPYGPAVLRYTACLVENALADPVYREGKFLDGRRIEKACRPLYYELKANLGTDATGRKAKERLWRLKSTFMTLQATPMTGFGDPMPGQAKD